MAFTLAIDRVVPKDIPFDAAVEFPPNNSSPPDLTHRVRRLNPGFAGSVYDWRCFVERNRTYTPSKHTVSRGVCPSWDNEARQPECATVLLHASPRRYAEWLENAMRDTVHRLATHGQRLVSIDDSNEWAEGANLEADARLGYAYRDATRRVVRVMQAQPSGASKSTRSTAPERVAIVIHAFYTELLHEMLGLLSDWDVPRRVVVTAVPERVAEVKKRLARLDASVESSTFENRRRDVLPFMRLANELLDAGEELVLKVHTKGSLRRDDGDVWPETCC